MNVHQRIVSYAWLGLARGLAEVLVSPLYTQAAPPHFLQETMDIQCTTLLGYNQMTRCLSASSRTFLRSLPVSDKSDSVCTYTLQNLEIG